MFDDRGRPERQDAGDTGGGRLAGLEPLEPRLLLSAVYPTEYEQYLVELINRARSDPAAEAALYSIDLNEGITGEQITTDAKQPLAVNPYLTDAARGHSQWMLDNDTFDHYGPGGSSPGDRMAAAGYGTLPNFGWGENIAFAQSLVYPNLTTQTAYMHEMLFVDADYGGRGHRKTICNSNYREIGAGVLLGEYGGNDYTMMVTEDFAYKFTDPFLTGVAYDELLVTGDEADGTFYHPGEALAGVTIQATRDSDGAEFTTATWASGGYALQLPDGTYTVTGTGGGLGGTVTYPGVVMNGQNVKRDFNPVSAEVRLTSPAGIEQVQRGDPYAVSWTGGLANTVLSVWRLGPHGLGQIGTDLPAGDGQHVWSTAGAPYGLYTFAAWAKEDGVWAAGPVASPGWVKVTEAAAGATTAPALGESGVLAAGQGAEQVPPLAEAPGTPGHLPASDGPVPGDGFRLLGAVHPQGLTGMHERPGAASTPRRHQNAMAPQQAATGGSQAGDDDDLLISLTMPSPMVEPLSRP